MKTPVSLKSQCGCVWGPEEDCFIGKAGRTVRTAHQISHARSSGACSAAAARVSIGDDVGGGVLVLFPPLLPLPLLLLVLLSLTQRNCANSSTLPPYPPKLQRTGGAADGKCGGNSSAGCGYERFFSLF